MTRAWKVAIPCCAGLLILVMILIVTGVNIAQSDWLREKVRDRIVAETERATGGKVEIGQFRFDWKTLQAELDGFTIHGTEPAGAPALARIGKLVIGLKVISLMERDVDIVFARVESPRVYLLVAADGSTNIPNPKIATKPSGNTIEQILDLRIANFSVRDGSVEIHAAGEAAKVASYDAAGKSLEIGLSFIPAGKSYSGKLSVMPLELRYGGHRQVQVNAEIALNLAKNRLQVTSAKLATAKSALELSGELRDFRSPVADAKYSGTISIEELESAIPWKSRQTGTVEVGGSLHYASASDYRTSGTARVKNLSYSVPALQLKELSGTGSFDITPGSIELTNVALGVLGGTVKGKAAIRDLDRYEVAGTLTHFDIARLIPHELPYDGILDGPFELSGRIPEKGFGHLGASVRLAISPAPQGMLVHGAIEAKYDAANDQIVFAPSYLTLPNSRLDMSGVPGKRIQVTLESHNLADLLPAISLTGQKELPVTLNSGSIRFDGAVVGGLDSPRIEGQAVGKNFVYSGQLVESMAGELTAQESGVTLQNGSILYRNVRANFQGTLGLTRWKATGGSPLSASGSLQNASLGGLLALAGRKDVPVTGTLTVSGQVNGTVGNPQASATFSLVNGTAYSEPFDRITGKLESAAKGAEMISAQWRTGARQAGLNARYEHVPDDFETGKLSFKLTTNRMSLAQFAIVRKEWPGLTGNTYLNSSGELAFSKSGVRLTAIDGELETSNVFLDAIQLSDLKLTAKTDGGSVKAHLQSNLAHADISGDGAFELKGDYPGTGQIHFAKVDLAVAKKLLVPGQGKPSFHFGGSAEGRATINGSLLKPEAISAEVEIPQFELRPDVSGVLAKDLSDVTIRNTQPIRASLTNSLVRVESARFTGPNTDVSLLGTVSLKDKNALNLNLNGNVDMKLARSFNPDIESSGNLLVRVTLRGTFDHPQLGGQADLRNGNLSLAGFPNGLSKANGRITFDENGANLQSLTAQTGGGTIQLDGFAAFSGQAVSFRISGRAKGVRVRYPEGVSSVSDANLTWTGSTERSVLAGDVTVHKVSYTQQSDFGAVLSLTSGGPGPTQAAPTGLLGGTQFDVKVQTAPDVSFQTGLVAGLQTEANLRLRGTAANPALLGRITISSGHLDFLGNKYVINQGTVSFFNPVRIEPIVDIDVSTQARGVDVTLSISGPLTKLNVSYRSDPPLQFSDIVGLLATGKTPSDPTIAARQTDTQQTWQQLGASAIVGQAIANPVSGRLQRFFGVSKLKIDPLLPGLGGAGSGTGGSNPGARLSLEQQVAPNVTFDYVISTNSTSSQIVRVEWAFSKHWSAVILREENSAFGIDFQYKKRFK
jgi:translocation and assembly module TamB